MTKWHIKPKDFFIDKHEFEEFKEALKIFNAIEIKEKQKEKNER